jgi:hypothetical protein
MSLYNIPSPTTWEIKNKDIKIKMVLKSYFILFLEGIDLIKLSFNERSEYKRNVLKAESSLSRFQRIKIVV